MGEGWFSNRNGFFRVELTLFLCLRGWIFEDDLFDVRERCGRMKIPTANIYKIRVLVGHRMHENSHREFLRNKGICYMRTHENSHRELAQAGFARLRRHASLWLARNRESSRIAFFLFRLLDLRSRHYATPDRLRVAVTAERKMLENPRRGFSLQDKECLNNSRQSS